MGAVNVKPLTTEGRSVYCLLSKSVLFKGFFSVSNAISKMVFTFNAAKYPVWICNSLITFFCVFYTAPRVHGGYAFRSIKTHDGTTASGTGKMRVASCETASGYFAS